VIQGDRGFLRKAAEGEAYEDEITANGVRLSRVLEDLFEGQPFV
jgi:hypothetical protein